MNSALWSLWFTIRYCDDILLLIASVDIELDTYSNSVYLLWYFPNLSKYLILGPCISILGTSVILEPSMDHLIVFLFSFEMMSWSHSLLLLDLWQILTVDFFFTCFPGTYARFYQLQRIETYICFIVFFLIILSIVHFSLPSMTIWKGVRSYTNSIATVLRRFS